MNEQDVTDIIHALDRLKHKGSYYVQNFHADSGRPTLGLLPPQSRILDLDKLPQPHSFLLNFRNF